MRAPQIRRLILVLCSLPWLGLTPACVDSDDGGRAGPNPTAPDFDLPVLDGSSIRLEDQRGKIVILDFWATWCTPCEVQMPILDAIWRDQAEERASAGSRPENDDLMIIGLSVDTDPISKVAEWIDERGFEYPIAIADQDLAMRFGVIGFPTLMILDPFGGIHTRHTGVLSRPEIEAILAKIRRMTQTAS